MLTRILPKSFDNSYRGHWLAIPILAVTAGMKAAQGVVSLVSPRMTLTGPDGIPLDTYSTAAQNTVIGIGGLLAMYLVLLMLVMPLLALIRYRTMIPLMYLLVLAPQIGSRIVLSFYPIARVVQEGNGFAGEPIGFWINLAILAVTVMGFALSLMDTKRAKAVP